MDLIDFQGLNCYHACIVNAVNFLGIDYLPSFSTLWSETDFSYDAVFNLYLTKRFPSRLKSLGVAIKKCPCTSQAAKDISFAAVEKGDWFIAGIDSFHMPWSPYYQLLNTYHYFLAQKTSEDILCCFDPTVNQSNIQIKTETVLPHVFDIVSINTCDKNPVTSSVVEEAKEILRAFPELSQRLIDKIKNCAGDNRKSAQELSIYINAMLTNRYLYTHYLNNIPEKCEAAEQLFGKKFMNKWIAVKNGLNKASLMLDNEAVLEEICLKLNQIFEAEMMAAKMILTN